MTADNELTSEGKALVSDWIHNLERVERLKREISRAEGDLFETEQRLAKWLAPDDMLTGEKIAVWRIDSLIQVERQPMDIYVVTLRKRGKQFEYLKQTK